MASTDNVPVCQTQDAEGHIASRSSDKGHIQCTFCGETFSRIEHLTRHSQAHNRTQSIKCTHCDKTFTRKDSAQRHERLHTQSSGNSSSLRDRPLRRTCNYCTKSRVKCSGGIPCTQCASRGLECIYVQRKRKRPRYSTFSPRPNSHGAEGEASASPDASSNGVQDDSLGRPDCRFDQPTASDAGAETGRLQGISLDENVSPDAGPLDVGAQQKTFDRDNIQDLAITNFGQHDSQLIGTNWLPFDNMSLFDPMISSPDDNYLYGGPSTQTLHSGALLEPETETGDAFASSSHAELGAQQHNLVSSLINSMAGTWPDTNTIAEHSTTSNSRECQATRYADGVGFRESRAERAIRERRASYTAQPLTSTQDQERPDWLSEISSRVLAERLAPLPSLCIPDSILDDVVSRTWPLKSDSNFGGEYLFYQDVLLDKPVLRLFITLYYRHFHPIYPFIDSSHLSMPIWGWSLCMATAAIGARYAGFKETTLFGDHLCSTLRELLLKQLEFGRLQESLPYIQANILAVAGLCQSSQPHLMRFGYNALASVMSSCLQLRLLEEDDQINLPQQSNTLEHAWVAWRFRETRRRTGLVIWIMESCFSFALEHPPITLSQNLKLRLPCQDKIWEAETSQAWFSAMSASPNLEQSNLAFLSEETARPAVDEAAEKLWSNGQAMPEMSQFATTVIIHVLLRRRWTASQYYQGLGAKQDDDKMMAPNNYLGAVPEYMTWRNRTCDCLDTLHWEAMSSSAKAAGFEGPIFLQLHLARLAILVPVRELLDHIANIPGETRDHLVPHVLYRSPGYNRKSRRTLSIWAYRDRYKARLAVVHAGAVFWHVRRYSSDSLIEPFTIFLAAMVLWAFGRAYGVEQQRLQSRADRSAGDQGGDASTAVLRSKGQPAREPTAEFEPGQRSTLPLNKRRMPNFIQIDRPMDDELVQHFIRSGDRMRLCMEDIDDLCSAEGPRQILLEAAAILSEGPKSWTVCEVYAAILHDMASSGL